MPNVGQLRKNLERIIDAKIAPADGNDLFNAALRDLAQVARIPAKTVIPFPVDGSTSVALPTGIVELRKVKVEFTDQQFVQQYALEDLTLAYGLTVYEQQTIEWLGADALPSPLTSRAGRFIVEYYRFPLVVVTDSDVPEIPDIFHDALPHYAAREWYDADDEPQLATKQDVKYLRVKAQLDDYAQKRIAGTATPKQQDARPPWARR